MVIPCHCNGGVYMLGNAKDIKTAKISRKSFWTSIIRKLIKRLINTDIKEVIVCIIGIFISRSSIIGELFPCSIAFLCAYYYASLYHHTNQFSRTKRLSPLILILTIFSIATVKFEIKYILVCIFIYIYYTSVRKKKKTVLLYDIFAFSMILFTINFIIMTSKSFVFNHLLINIFESLFMISLTFLIKELIVAIRKKSFNSESIACFLAVAFISVLGFKEVQAMGFNILLYSVFSLMMLILAIGVVKEIYIMVKRNNAIKRRRKLKASSTIRMQTYPQDENDIDVCTDVSDSITSNISSQKLTAKVYYSRLAKEKNEVSGDNYFYRISGNKFFAILCDGMGTGTQAFNESKKAIDLIIKLLDVNFNEDQLINTVNSLLLLNLKDDRYVALDFAVIDFDTQELRFYKAGAAQSYLISEDEIRKFQASSLPAGILESFDCYHNKINVKENDIIIMITDGIADSIAEDVQKSLDKYLEIIKHKDPQSIADSILTYALRGCDKVIDDMTVLVIKIV